MLSSQEIAWGRRTPAENGCIDNEPVNEWINKLIKENKEKTFNSISHSR